MAPRRDGERETPVFLAKTYRMVEESGSGVVGWAPDGASFVIVDCERFTQEVVPSYFKHKNFSSFIRQLNFYGFRKVKDSRPRGQTRDKSRPQRWEFQHPSFRRGRRELLKDIRRRSYQDASNAAPAKGDVDKLKDELAALQQKMATLTGSMKHLIGAVHVLQKDAPPMNVQLGIKPDPMLSPATAPVEASPCDLVQSAAPGLVRVKPEPGLAASPPRPPSQRAPVPPAPAPTAPAPTVSCPSPAPLAIPTPSSLEAWTPGPAAPAFEALEGELNGFYDGDFFDEDLRHELQLESPRLSRLTSLDAALGNFQPMNDEEAHAVQADAEARMMADPVPLTRLDSALGPLGGLPVLAGDDAMDVQVALPPSPLPPLSSPALSSSPHPKPKVSLRRRLETLTPAEQQVLVERMANLILRQSGMDDGTPGSKGSLAAEAAGFASGAQAPNVEESISLRLPCGMEDVLEEDERGIGTRRTPVDLGLILPITSGAREEKS